MLQPQEGYLERLLVWWFFRDCKLFPGFLPTGSPCACGLSNPCFDGGVCGFSYFLSFRLSLSFSRTKSTTSSRSLSLSKSRCSSLTSAALIFADKNNHPLSQIFFRCIYLCASAKFCNLLFKVSYDITY